MNHKIRTRLTLALLVVAWPVVLADAIAAQGGEKKAVATVGAVDGALLVRGTPTGPWQSIKAGDAVPPGSMLVALPGASLTSRNDAVLVKMLADIGNRGPFPVFESAVVIHDNPKVDLDFTLDRGIAAVANLRLKGGSTVRLRLHGKTFDLDLTEPGTVVGFEVFGRHPPRTPTLALDKKGKITSKDVPTLDLVVLVVKGAAVLHDGGHTYPLNAPPGPARLQWDSVADRVSLSQLEKLPEPILPTGPAEEKYYKEICGRAARLAKEPVAKVLAEYQASKDPKERRAIPVVAAALDDLPTVLAALGDAQHADVRDHTVTVLRNWIGRRPGQVEQLFATLLKEQKYTPVQAKTLVHLLYGATEQQRAEPATYEMLIKLLDHSKLPIRELARWHLVRLAPAGKKIAFDAAAPPEQRQKAYEQWQALIPAGQLPPRVEAVPEKK